MAGRKVLGPCCDDVIPWSASVPSRLVRPRSHSLHDIKIPATESEHLFEIAAIPLDVNRVTALNGFDGE